MRHQLLSVVVVCTAVFVLSCANQTPKVGSQPSSQTVKKAQQVDQSKTFAGSIDKIYKAAGIVTVVHWPLYKTFQIDRKCEIVIPGREQAALDDFHVNELVIVSYREVGHVLVATRFARRSEEYIQERQEQLQRLEQMLNPSPNELGPPGP
ncbi:MAG TPA: hypothetical protein VLZ12_14440 [Verrucomicrobiae bacterium]|nr:hypothetical protein [Verrucomicrobiae bacterium]